MPGVVALHALVIHDRQLKLIQLQNFFGHALDAFMPVLQCISLQRLEQCCQQGRAKFFVLDSLQFTKRSTGETVNKQYASPLPFLRNIKQRTTRMLLTHQVIEGWVAPEPQGTLGGLEVGGFQQLDETLQEFVVDLLEVRYLDVFEEIFQLL